MAVRKRGQRGGRALRKDETKTTNVNETRPKKIEDYKSKKALVVAQEIKIARLLANNDKRVRDKVLKRLSKWLTVRSQSSFVFTKTDFMSLWKGLFYCMWMSDKMLIQEELAETISKLVHCLKSKDTIILYTSCALETLSTEWFGIDQYRLNKFAMLSRRILRQTFVVCKNQSWNMEWVTKISQMFTQLFLHEKTDLGFKLHVTEIYLQELAKISNGSIAGDVVHELIKPFIEYLITTRDEREMKNIMHHVFRYLIFQSDVGLDHTEKFKAWKDAGFPCAHIDNMQKIEISEENSDNEDKGTFETETQNEIDIPLDPRAGKVNVDLPQISFNPAKIVELFSMYKFHPSSTAKSRRQLLRLLNEYTELSQGRLPLGIKRVRKPNSYKKEMKSKKVALRLIQFEKNLFSDKVNKKRKRKNKETICDQVSEINDPNNKDALDLECNDLKSELTDTTSTMKALQDTEAKTVKMQIPLKKRKISDSTCDTSNIKSKVNETKKKPRIEISKKNKATKIKLNKKDNKSTVNKNLLSDKVNKKRKKENEEAICDQVSEINNPKNRDALPPESIEPKNKLTDTTAIAKKANLKLKSETKKAVIRDVQTSNNTDQCTSTSLISSKKIPLKEIDNKSVAKKTMLKNKQKMSLKNEVPCQIKSQTNLNNFLMEKKKVIFGLSRNTMQHRSDYLKQVRKSPTIPFDANKKPLASVLKVNPIPSPLNPFYKNNVRDGKVLK